MSTIPSRAYNLTLCGGQPGCQANIKNETVRRKQDASDENHPMVYGEESRRI